jgi:cytochrome c-type biogenesis protein CcmE
VKSKRKKQLALALTITAVLGLIVIVLRGSPVNYWITPGELEASGQGAVRTRVAGEVIRDSTEWDGVNGQLVFKIKAQGEKTVLPVVYRGFPPDQFTNESVVIVEGAMNGDTFSADRLLVRCPENYLAEKAAVSVSKALKVEGTLYRD